MIKLLNTPDTVDVTHKLENLCQIKCNRKVHENSCFVHNKIFINYESFEQCKPCGINSVVMTLDQNLFALVVNMHQLEQCLVEKAQTESQNSRPGSASYRARGMDNYFGRSGTQGE